MSKKTDPRPNLKPLESDRVRRALQSYLVELVILRDDVGGYTVAFDNSFVKDPRELPDQDFLVWYKVNQIVRGLGGFWVKATRFTKGHWRIPKH